jgi:hypothetical protein
LSVRNARGERLSILKARRLNWRSAG